MKKIMLVALAGALALSLAPAGANHNGRSVSGSILAPSTNIPAQGPLSRHARCAYLLGGADAQGLVGYVVELDAAEGDGAHTFTLTSGTPGADFLVVFYADLGTCDNDPAPITTGQSVNPGDESGTIPEGTTSAIIIFEGAVTDAAFTFSIA